MCNSFETGREQQAPWFPKGFYDTPQHWANDLAGELNHLETLKLAYGRTEDGSVWKQEREHGAPRRVR